ncbi:Flavin-dependent oxidoreductase, luciferase family (includes alkanesulfonate monooxygenase SsuD and methylene tetrahydromethanopterin reductase) [Pseudonocardia thermophila]|jgi:Coenzyme F420-dependent N5,N10-methylene tetrahydromethanopterin reductase and related flavin-dependent oxidoreductases|uniref:Flavin-dependent oxidoreductase, luciferase family (Includes alkanesulfonate monooxygenase SsuD and methylene tetrahydromethanopterin reductase) n=1 Tax=Pseudonocardia thermophila TaxID=1848 RepID=A0A1M6RS33_PSETH|nr:LLM class flavin-dependent oxidoreductase [Pseudonocardia thermophila]SHK35332.1 Flavin-dependent oxidoreductase, luciferase family (includes alkanesulfonate monooxygenase SsuD and methylene tetrahydromethanopterin reductase) [Pseudonocardia thermophila]
MTQTASQLLGLAPTEPRPPAETQPVADRRTTNPLLGDQKMKLGLFGTNCSYGLIMSHAPSTYEVSWAHTKEIAQRADELGLEALVPIARWKGFGGSTNFNGNCFETYTWAAGIAEATERIAITATSHLPTVHPIVAAKAATTIDRISGGRFVLNLVMGWVTPEMEMFGGKQREHDERYAFGQEWIDYVTKLWTEPGSFDFEGKYFSGREVEAYPKPHQGPRPVLLNAGNSPAGIDFSARNVDINFASLDTLENIKAYTTAIRKKAREEYNRDISVMTYGLVVCRDTEDEAKRAFQQVVDEGDWGAAGNVIKIAGSGSSQSFDHAVKEFQERFIAGWGGYPIVGTPEQVTEELGKLNEAGMDGMIMGLIDYNEELKYLGETVLPLMREAGLRK